MPCLTIFTNLTRSQLPKNFISKIIPVLVEGVKKPAEASIDISDFMTCLFAMQKFICVVNNDCLVTINGDSETPGIVAKLESIGHLGLEENNVIVKGLSTFFEHELGIDSSRFFLTFYDLEKHNVAKYGCTVSVP